MYEEKFIKGQGYDWNKSLSDTDTIRVFVFHSKQIEIISCIYDFAKSFIFASLK